MARWALLSAETVGHSLRDSSIEAAEFCLGLDHSGVEGGMLNQRNQVRVSESRG